MGFWSRTVVKRGTASPAPPAFKLRGYAPTARGFAPTAQGYAPPQPTKSPRRTGIKPPKQKQPKRASHPTYRGRTNQTNLGRSNLTNHQEMNPGEAEAI